MNELFAASFTEANKGNDMPLSVMYNMPDITTAASLVIDCKVRTIQRILNLKDLGLAFTPQAQKENLLDLGLACGELVAIVAEASAHCCTPGHRLHSAAAGLSNAHEVLRLSHTYMTKEALKGPPVVTQPIGPAWWPVTPEPLVGNWDLIGLENHVTLG